MVCDHEIAQIISGLPNACQVGVCLWSLWRITRTAGANYFFSKASACSRLISSLPSSFVSTIANDRSIRLLLEHRWLSCFSSGGLLGFLARKQATSASRYEPKAGVPSSSRCPPKCSIHYSIQSLRLGDNVHLGKRLHIVSRLCANTSGYAQRVRSS